MTIKLTPATARQLESIVIDLNKTMREKSGKSHPRPKKWTPERYVEYMIGKVYLGDWKE